MIDLLEKAMLTGLGALSLTQKRAEELLQEAQERYRLSEDEGRQLLDRLQGAAREGRERMEEMVQSEVARVIDRLGLVPRTELDRLADRVAQLEAQLHRSETGQC